MEQSTDIKDLAKALSLAQAEIKGAVKDTANPFFKSRYADLSAVWDACREAITKNGLSVIQTGGTVCDTVIVVTQLMHSSGQWIRGSFSAKPVKADPQGVGSCITYLRRYSLAAMVGVAPEDDDGNAASMPQAKPKIYPDKVDKKTGEIYGNEPEPPPFDDEDPTAAFMDSIEDKQLEPPPAKKEKSASICGFGTYKGTPWNEIPAPNLKWYKKVLMANIVDPTKQEYLKKNESELMIVLELLGEK